MILYMQRRNRFAELRLESITAFQGRITNPAVHRIKTLRRPKDMGCGGELVPVLAWTQLMRTLQVLTQE